MTILLLLLETLLSPCAALGVVVSFFFSRRRGVLSDLPRDLPERLGGISPEAKKLLAGRAIVWLHAASAGEARGLAPLVARLAARPNAAVLVTSTTAAGRGAARGLPGVAWAQLAPLDAWPCVARFLRAARPERLILSETELWPATLILASRAGLRPVLINARLTRRSLARYRWIRPVLAPALRALAAVGAQSEEEARRFRALGVPAERIRAIGNTKYDAAKPDTGGVGVASVLARLGWAGAPIFVAGSTHPAEEDVVLAACARARERVPGLRLVLAPRHPERSQEAWDALEAAGLRPARWSRLAAGEAAPARAEALLVDAMGVLPSLYARARAAFVGGTLAPVGGHNLLEPAAAGVPVLYGPHTSHVEEPARLLEREGGGARVRNAEELGDRLARFAADPAAAREAGARAAQAARALRGAAARVLALLEETSAPPAARVLVVRLSSLGDVVLTRPVFAGLRARWPDARLAILVKPAYAPVVQAWPEIDETIVFRGLRRAFREIGSRRFTHLLDLHATPRSLLLRLLAGVPNVSVYRKDALARRLFVAFGRRSPALARGTAERYLDALAAWGVPPAPPEAPARLDALALDPLARKLEQAGTRAGDRLVGLHPGAAWATKRWPAERFAALCGRLSAAGFKPVLVGASGDAALCARIAAASGAVDLAGRLTLAELAALMGRLALFVANDSGPMHLAAASGVPVVAIFGSTSRELGFFPQGPGSRVVEADLACRPCHLHGRDSCPEGHFLCMRLITTERVAEICAAALAAGAPA
ncbi:MAG: hypothetical protein HY552_02610 [Elusimicrobia bacterium]|nr:hypothetical protein [Elusimicrobiota bacterium]